jgi:hypothetical protein
VVHRGVTRGVGHSAWPNTSHVINALAKFNAQRRRVKDCASQQLRQLRHVGSDPSRIYSRPSRAALSIKAAIFFRLFFGVIAAVEAFGAVFVEPDHNPMKLDHGTPSVSASAFGFGFGHAQSPRSKSESLAMFAAMRRASPREKVKPQQ